MNHAEFLRKIERYIKKNRISPTKFGMMAVGDFNFLRQLKEGRSPNLKTVAKIEAYMKESRNA